MRGQSRRRSLFGAALALAIIAASLGAGIGGTARPAAASVPTLPLGFAQDVVASGLTYPTALATLPDGRILVLEKAGLVRVIKDGVLLPTPFADLRAKVNDFWDRGLTGIAVDPSFSTNQFIYLFYPYDSTGNDGSGPVTNRLTRLTAAGDVMAAGSETVILGSVTGAGCPTTTDPNCMPQDFYGHASDSLRFAPDGTLFVSMGDASSWDVVDDRALRSQSIDQYPGKILHITKSGQGIATNPYWNGDPNAVRSKVWATGLRNPFRMNLDATGRLVVGDVGWNAVEEINVVPAGANLGWPCWEGTARQPGYESKSVCQSLYATVPNPVKAPIITWNHDNENAAAVGGPFTPSTSGFPAAYQGGFFYADYARSWIRFARLDSAGNLSGAPVDFASSVDGPVDLTFGLDGNLYYVAITAGEVRRIRPTTSPSSVFLSDLTPSATPTNGWGPYERDRSNGEDVAGDGQTLTIDGQTWAKGLGVHALSDLRYTIPATCTLTAQIGVDDELATGGTVVFEVWNGTTTRLYQSPVKNGTQPATPISVDLAGVTDLRLLVTDGGDGIAADHADWADAKITCGSGGADTTPPVLSAITASPTSTSATVTWTTDEPADSQVDHGTTTSYGASTALDPAKVTTHSQTISGLTPNTTYHYRVRSADAAGNVATSSDLTFTTTGSGTGSATFLSDLTPSATPTNGWGPYERDRSNGEDIAGDGRVLTINGQTWAKGLGVHAVSDIRYTIPNSCTLTAQIGVDDEIVTGGTVVFEVWNGTTTRLYQSPIKNSTQAATPISVNLAGVTNLRLVVTNGGDNINADHADWADAKITCGTPPPPPTSLFGPATAYASGPHAHAVAITDLNADGKNDIAVANAGNNTVSVLLGNGAGGLGAATSFATGSEPKSVVARDLNADGKLDLVTANQGTSTISVLLGNGNGTFQAKTDYLASPNSHEVAIGDVNADGRLDAVAVGWGGTVASVLLGNGNGTFQTKVDYTTGNVPNSVVIVDLNGDARPDIASTAHGSNAVSVLLGNGNGTFQPVVNHPVGAGPHSIRTADLNGDGRADLVTANETSNNVTVLLGTGTGSFQPPVQYATGTTPKSVAIADINGDGKLDLLTANINNNYPNLVNPGGDTVSVLLGNGDGTFAARTDHAVGQAPFSVAVGILNADQKLDLVTANWHDGGVTVRLNTGP